MCLNFDCILLCQPILCGLRDAKFWSSRVDIESWSLLRKSPIAAVHPDADSLHCALPYIFKASPPSPCVPKLSSEVVTVTVQPPQFQSYEVSSASAQCCSLKLSVLFLLLQESWLLYVSLTTAHDSAQALML